MQSSRLARLRTLRAVLVAGGLAAIFPVDVGAGPYGEPVPISASVAIRLDTVEVTGSRVKRAGTDTPLPMTTITRAQIEQSGEISIAGVLRHLVFNSFGSYTPTSGTGSGQGGAQVSLRGLGAARTLVLLDGRRLPGSPGAAGKTTQNVNIVPMAIVERIEILRDGASAIYGADAIGGVINIITRRDREGMRLSGQWDQPTASGGDANAAALSGGLSGDRGALSFAVEHHAKAIIYSRDRDVVRDVQSPQGDPGTIYQYDAAGNVVPQPSNPDAQGQPRNFRPFDNCPTQGFGSDPGHPYSTVIDGVCRFRNGGQTVLNADLERNSLALHGEYLLSDALSGFGQFTTLSAQSFGRIPVAAVDALVEGVRSPDARGNRGIRIAPDHPNNPNPGSTLVLNYRPLILGTRDNTVSEWVDQFLLGLQGRESSGRLAAWELAASYNDYRLSDIGLNNVLKRELQAAVDAGRFNPFRPDPVAADEFRHTTVRDGQFRTTAVNGRVDLDLQLAGLPVATVLGAEYHDDDFAIVSDAQSAQEVFIAPNGAISGFRASNVYAAKGGAARGRRSYQAAFVEAETQAFDDRLELNLALRVDDYSDVGQELSPKALISYALTDRLRLRASYGEGFRAPDLALMYSAPSDATTLIVDRLACRDRPDDPAACATSVETTVLDGNPKLRAEESANLNIGLVWSVSDRAALWLDHYAIRIRDAVAQLPAQTIFDNDLRCAEQARTCDPRSEGFVVRDEGGNLLFAYSPAINATRLETDGIDFGASYRYDSTAYGSYRFAAQLSRVLSYRRQDAPNAALIERLDTLNSGFEIFPEVRASATLSWSQQRLSAALAVNYIGEVTDCDAADKVRGNPACNSDFDDYRTVDLQFGVDTPWKQSLALGARNLFDEKPSVSRYVNGPFVPGVFYALHDSDQRVLYLQLTQRF